MNRNTRTVSLRSLMVIPEGWGHVQGRKLGQVLTAKIGSSGQPEVVRLSLDGVKRVDVTFAAEAIITVVKQHLRRHGVCITDLVSNDVLENIAAAAERASTPVVIWRGEVPQIVGPRPVAGLTMSLDLVMARPRVRAGELAAELEISLANASNKLKQLWEGGYLVRDQVTAASGGNEFVYARIG